jgi:cellulose synthase/poly-beta-1,6-N-acetylglucosamine synthase-like glycosyltransferase
MPTAVLDLDLTNLPEQITGLDSYSHAFILIRYKSKPVGKLKTALHNGRLTIAHIYPDMIHAVEPVLKKAMVHDYLQWDESDVTDPTPLKATIAICTRNRTDDLRRCLEALMKLPDDGQEILVIDNCPSTNETKDLAASFPKIKYVLETRPGLDFARNTALEQATGDVIAFTDDDAVAEGAA